MRLIDVKTGLFEEFIGQNIPKYAILSHTWEQEEVSFADMGKPSAKDKKGYKKIEMTRQLTAQIGLSWAWVDTCCIDKSSSAELTEAINSMYRWYQRSEMCYTYLSDLPETSPLHAVGGCRWFTRGWTLQELIAPKELHFFDQEWNYRGSRKDMIEVLSDITGINTHVLTHQQKLSSVAVAQKMSWAANRETTRIEDVAYSLLGIFDVNMPLLYGEEEKAFRRLQEEIIKSTADLSIFAWRDDTINNQTRPTDRIFCGILAKNPKPFAWCRSLTKKTDYEQQEFSISNIGVKTNVQLLSGPRNGDHVPYYVLPLACSCFPHQSLSVQLRKCGPDHFIREDPFTLTDCTHEFFPGPPRTRYLLTELPDVELPSNSDMSRLIGGTRPHVLEVYLANEIIIYDAWPLERYDDEDQLFFVSGDPKRDSVALRFSLYFSAESLQQDSSMEFEFMCYAIGWSLLEQDAVQCTLVDYQLFKTPLSEVRSKITSWEHDRQQVISSLRHHKIPQRSTVVFKIPGTSKSALVSFKLALRSDLKICRNKFWRMEFFCDIYENHMLPRAEPDGVWLY